MLGELLPTPVRPEPETENLPEVIFRDYSTGRGLGGDEPTGEGEDDEEWTRA